MVLQSLSMAKLYVYNKPEGFVVETDHWPTRLSRKPQTAALTPLLFQAPALPSPELQAMSLMETDKSTGMAWDRMEVLKSKLMYPNLQNTNN